MTDEAVCIKQYEPFGGALEDFELPVIARVLVWYATICSYEHLRRFVLCSWQSLGEGRYKLYICSLASTPYGYMKMILPTEDLSSLQLGGDLSLIQLTGQPFSRHEKGVVGT